MPPGGRQDFPLPSTEHGRSHLTRVLGVPLRRPARRAPGAHTQERPCGANSIEEQKNEDDAGNPHPGGLDRPPCGGGVRRRGGLSSQFSDLGAESVGDTPDRTNDPSRSGNRALALVVCVFIPQLGRLLLAAGASPGRETTSHWEVPQSHSSTQLGTGATMNGLSQVSNGPADRSWQQEDPVISFHPCL